MKPLLAALAIVVIAACITVQPATVAFPSLDNPHSVVPMAYGEPSEMGLYVCEYPTVDAGMDCISYESHASIMLSKMDAGAHSL